MILKEITSNGRSEGVEVSKRKYYSLGFVIRFGFGSMLCPLLPNLHTAFNFSELYLPYLTNGHT